MSIGPQQPRAISKLWTKSKMKPSESSLGLHQWGPSGGYNYHSTPEPKKRHKSNDLNRERSDCQNNHGWNMENQTKNWLQFSSFWNQQPLKSEDLSGFTRPKYASTVTLLTNQHPHNSFTLILWEPPRMNHACKCTLTLAIISDHFKEKGWIDAVTGDPCLSQGHQHQLEKKIFVKTAMGSSYMWLSFSLMVTTDCDPKITDRLPWIQYPYD